MGRKVMNRRKLIMYVDEDIYYQLELLLGDPVKGGFRYGAVSEVGNRLFSKFIDTSRQPGVDVVKYLEAFGVKVPDLQKAKGVSEDAS